MNIIQKISQIWHNFTTKFKSKTQKEIRKEQINNIDEELEEDRGYARGKQKQQEKELKQLKQSIEQERDKNITQHLNQQREELRKKLYENATSLDKLLQIAKENKVKLLSRDMQEEFGKLGDFWFTQTGQIAIADTNGNVVMSGRQTTDIFRNPGGLRNEVKNGFISLNSNEKGQPVETPENQKVPALIKAPNGDMTFTESYQEDYLKQVGQLKSQLSQALQRESAKEKALVKLSDKIDNLERQVEVESVMNDNTREEIDRKIEEMKKVTGQFDSMQRQMTRMATQRNLGENMAKDMIQRQEQIEKQLLDRIDKDELEIQEDKIRRIANLAVDIADQVPSETPQQPQQIETNDEDEETIEVG